MRHESAPMAGSQRNCTAKICISTMPSANAGNEMPDTASVMPSRSGQRLRQTADSVPITMPIVTDHAIAADGQPERRQEALGDFGADGALGAQRLAEVAVQHAARETDELLGQRLVEPEVLAHQRDGLGRRVRARSQARRIAGQQMHEHEHQDADDQQRRKEAEQALD